MKAKKLGSRPDPQPSHALSRYVNGSGVMSEVATDEARENRILMEAVVDAYDEEERAMGWYYYLEDKLRFPFQARCIAERRVSPLSVGDKVKVVGMVPTEVCMHEVFVEIQRARRKSWRFP